MPWVRKQINAIGRETFAGSFRHKAMVMVNVKLLTLSVCNREQACAAIDRQSGFICCHFESDSDFSLVTQITTKTKCHRW